MGSVAVVHDLACGWFALWHVGSSQGRDWTHVSCIDRWILNHWTTREILSVFKYRTSEKYFLSYTQPLPFSENYPNEIQWSLFFFFLPPELSCPPQGFGESQLLLSLHWSQSLPEEREDLWRPWGLGTYDLPRGVLGHFARSLQAVKGCGSSSCVHRTPAVPPSYALQHPHKLPLLLHQPGSEETARLEARRWRGKVGGEGSGLSSEEVKEEERSHGWAGEGAQLPGAAQQVRDHPPLPGRAASSVPPQGAAPRHLLPGVALAGPAVPPRAEAAGVLRVPIRLQAERGVHQPLPLPPRGDARWVSFMV